MQTGYKKLIGVRCGHTCQLPSGTEKQQSYIVRPQDAEAADRDLERAKLKSQELAHSLADSPPRTERAETESHP